MKAFPTERFGCPTLLVLVGLCLTLAACGSNSDDLHRFVARTKARKTQPIEPVPTIASYNPATYKPARRAPFTVPDHNKPHSDNGIRPNRNRKLEPLEQYPLDALEMVGTITFGGITYALISAPDGIVHRIAPGNHMGHHYGKVESIGPKGLTLTEIVPDSNGGYIKRGAALAPPH